MGDTPFDFENTPITKNIKLVARYQCGTPWDPTNPTLDGFKTAVDNDIDVAIGTEIPDEWNGNSNPLIVAQKLDSSNNSAYGGAEGYILLRKFVEPTSQQYNPTNVSAYGSSLMNSYLNNDYLSNCSTSLKNIVSPLNIQFYNGTAVANVDATWFLISGLEIVGYPSGDGVMWEYWKQKTGLNSPTNAYNNGRIPRDRNGTAQNVFLRSSYGAGTVLYLDYLGGISYNALPTQSLGVLPACFVAKAATPAPKVTLTEFKEAIDNDTAKDTYPVGTEIEDTWDGNDNPLIVAQYLDSTNNTSYGGAEGVVLVRKYVEPTSKQFNASGNMGYWTSDIKNYLDGEYLENCSDTLKSLVSTIDVPYSTSPVTSKFFLMSDTEICGAGYDSITEGIMLDYWKEQTGFTTPNNTANAGRIVRDRSGAAQYVWLRSGTTATSRAVCYLTIDGSITNGASSGSLGVLPACFIAKTPTEPTPSGDGTLADLKVALKTSNPETYYPVGTEFADTYAGQSNPLIVAQYLNDSNNSSYGGATGVILVRKFVDTTLRAFGSSTNYSGSSIQTFLNGTYLDSCSANLKDVISNISIPLYSVSTAKTSTLANQKFFLMSGIEVMGTFNSGEGFGWDYWKKKTGLSSADNSAKTGRDVKTRTGIGYAYFLRSQYSSSYVVEVQSGGITYGAPSGELGILPACFISAD